MPKLESKPNREKSPHESRRNENNKIFKNKNINKMKDWDKNISRQSTKPQISLLKRIITLTNFFGNNDPSWERERERNGTNDIKNGKRDITTHAEV